MKINAIKKRLISLLLTVVMVLSLIPLTTFTVYAGNKNIQTDKLENGSLMTDGCTYVITKDTSLQNLKVANDATVVLYIQKGVTLSVTGSNGTNANTPQEWPYAGTPDYYGDPFRQYNAYGAATGGKAAIYLPEGATLILVGGGTLYAKGGNGGAGTNALAFYGCYAKIDDEYSVTQNTGGGKGGAGGGAAIGTDGADGTYSYNNAKVGSRNLGIKYEFYSNIYEIWTDNRTMDSLDGADGSKGANSANAGTLYNLGVTIASGTSGGAAGSGGADSSDYSDKRKIKTFEIEKKSHRYNMTCIFNAANKNKGGVAGQAGSGSSSNPLGAGGAGGGYGANGGNGVVTIYGEYGLGYDAKELVYIPAGKTGADGTQGTRGNNGTYHDYTSKTAEEKIAVAKSDKLKNNLEYEVTLNWLDKSTAADSTKKTVKAYYGLDMVELTEAQIPTKAGYTFKGFYSQTECKGTQYYDAEGKSTHVYDGTDVAITGEATLYAGWEVADNDITYYDGTEELSGTRILDLEGKTTYTVLNQLTLPVRVIKEDHLFSGWYDNEALSGDPVTQIAVGNVGDRKFYSKWQKLEGTKAESETLLIKALRSAPEAPITTVTYAEAKVTVKLDGTKADVEQVQLKNGTKALTMAGSNGDYSYTAEDDGSLSGEWQVYVNAQNSGKTVTFGGDAAEVELVTIKITVNNNGSAESGHSVVLKNDTDIMALGESSITGVYSTVVFTKDATYKVFVDDTDTEKTVSFKDTSATTATVNFYTVSVITKLDGTECEIGAVELRSGSDAIVLDGMNGEYSLTKLEGKDDNSYNLYVDSEKVNDTLYAFTDAGNKSAALEYSSVTVDTQNNGIKTELGTVTLRDSDSKVVHTLNPDGTGTYSLIKPKNDTEYSIFVDDENTGKTISFIGGSSVKVGYYTARVTTKKDGITSKLGTVTLRAQGDSAELTMTEQSVGVYELRCLSDETTVYDVLVGGMKGGTLKFAADKNTCTVDFSTTVLSFKRDSENINMGEVVLKGSDGDADIQMEYNADDGSYKAISSASGTRTVYLDGENTEKSVTLGQSDTINVYSLKYNADGGHGIDESNVELYLAGEKASIISDTPVKHFNQFTGWSDGNNTYTADLNGDFGTVTMTKDIVLTTLWSPPADYEVRYTISDESTPWQYCTLADALTLAAAHIDKVYTVELMKDKTLTEALTVPENVELVIRKGITLTGNLVNNRSVTVNGTLSGDITNNAGAQTVIVGIVTGKIKNSGTLTFSGVITDMETNPVTTSPGKLNGSVENSGIVKLCDTLMEMKALDDTGTKYERVETAVFGTVGSAFTNKEGGTVNGGGIIQSDDTLLGGGTVSALVSESGAVIENAIVGVTSNAGVIKNCHITSGTDIGGALEGTVYTDSGVTFASTLNTVYDTDKKAVISLVGNGTVSKADDFSNATAFAHLLTESGGIYSTNGTIHIRSRITVGSVAFYAGFYTVTKPENLTYSGDNKGITLSEGCVPGLGTTTVYYRHSTGTDTWSDWTTDAPKNAGTYQVKINVADGNFFNGMEDVTATGWTYSISKADQTVSSPTAQTDNIKCFTITLDTAAAGQGDTYYAKSSTDTKPDADSTEWQSSPVFTGLEMDTEYYFFVKYSGNDNYNGIISESSKIKTLDHYHEWTYELKEGTIDTINAVCVGPGGETACHAFDDTLIRTIKISAESPVYDGKAHGAKLDQTALAEITELPKIRYQLKNADGSYGRLTETVPVNAGTYKASFTVTYGKDNKKSVTAEVVYTIKSADITGISVAQKGSLTYNREKQTAEVTCTAKSVNSQTITFTYSDSETGIFRKSVPAFTDAGKHTVYYKVSAPNHNEEKGSFSVTIAPKTTDLSVEAIADVSYTGEQRKPIVTVRDENVLLIKDRDYTVYYGENVEEGVDAGTVTVTFINNYKGEISKTFTVNRIKISGDTTANHTDVKTYTVSFDGNRPENTTVVWEVSGGSFSYVGANIGTETVSILCDEVGTLKVTAILVDYYGRPVQDYDGSIVEDTLVLNVQAKPGNIINIITIVLKNVLKSISRLFKR